MNLKDALRNTWNAQEHLFAKKEQYDPRICQCCGYFKKRDDDPECVCDGLKWYQKNDQVECEAHRFARAVGEKKTLFLFGKKH